MKKNSFNFGMNWLNYSIDKLDEQKLNDAKKSLINLIGEDYIKEKSFLDIGCGSGIFSISAEKLRARKVVGFDLSEESIKSAKLNATRFNVNKKVIFYRASILNRSFISSIGKFDIVYSWGVLHHTGKMWKSIDIASKLVKNGGLLVIAIYNKHWSSPIWKQIKILYNSSSKSVKKILAELFYVIIMISKTIITGKNPFKVKRGMDFYYNVIDWIGGYPYEYATIDDIIMFLQKRNFKLLKIVRSHVPTGCNEFVFRKGSI